MPEGIQRILLLLHPNGIAAVVEKQQLAEMPVAMDPVAGCSVLGVPLAAGSPLNVEVVEGMPIAGNGTQFV